MQKQEEPNVPLNLTHAQRKVLAEVLPTLADRLKIDEAASRTISFTLKELQEIAAKCEAAVPKARTAWCGTHSTHRRGRQTRPSNSTRRAASAGIPAAERVYQFKITLKGIKPPIWRRIQTKDCTLDKLHEHIQTAMGWTNSHLHQFKIDGVRLRRSRIALRGLGGRDATGQFTAAPRSARSFPTDGKRFRFDYEYDFGDGWEHEILFEGCLQAEKGTRYPLCVEGERACPPEDVGGIYGYQEYLEAMADPKHERARGVHGVERAVRSRGVRRPGRHEGDAEGPAELAGDGVSMALEQRWERQNRCVLALGKAQVDAMFRRQEVHAVDDSEFLPWSRSC